MSDSVFNINFGNAKPLEMPPEGNYTLVVSDYEVKQAAKEESRQKGFNIALTFSFAEPDVSNMKVYHNLWVSYENPWAAKLFFEALTGKELNDDSFDITDKDYFIGESVGAAIVHESYQNNAGVTKEKLAVASPDAFYTV